MPEKDFFDCSLGSFYNCPVPKTNKIGVVASQGWFKRPPDCSYRGLGAHSYSLRQISAYCRLMPLGFERLPPHHCPGGTTESSPAFQRWDPRRLTLSPAGTAEPTLFLPSLRDLSPATSKPSVETLGYSHPSLRDEGVQVPAALGCHGRLESPNSVLITP
jgi:hypothetical protein